LQQVQDIIQRAKEAGRSSSPSEILRRAISVQENNALIESTNEIMDQATKALNVAIQSDQQQEELQRRLSLTTALPNLVTSNSLNGLCADEILSSAKAALRKSMTNSLPNISNDGRYYAGEEFATTLNGLNTAPSFQALSSKLRDSSSRRNSFVGGDSQQLFQAATRESKKTLADLTHDYHTLKSIPKSMVLEVQKFYFL